MTVLDQERTGHWLPNSFLSYVNHLNKGTALNKLSLKHGSLLTYISLSIWNYVVEFLPLFACTKIKEIVAKLPLFLKNSHLAYYVAQNQ